MQLYDQPAYLLARITLEVRMVAEIEETTEEALEAVLERLRGLLGRCFGCAEYLAPERVAEGYSLCCDCQGKKQWERN